MNRNMCKNREPLFYLVLYFIFVMILYWKKKMKENIVVSINFHQDGTML